ncbi:MAG TPA: hypothetical protein VFQ35_23000 [Polyangiaceae bacterium]|nr:hypothetical protein [Polyangiaceae bacterium]
MNSPPNPANDVWARIDAVVTATRPPRNYEAFLERAATSHEDYLFAARVVRFGLRDTDRLLPPRDLTVRATPGGVELASRTLGGALEVDGVKEPAAEALLALFNGERTLADARREATGAQTELERLVSAAFARMLFAPFSLTELEGRISGTEVTRFVGTPYEIDRRYWENMRDVRELSAHALDGANDTQSFVRALQRLHVVALMGASLDNFYRPASRTSSGVQPGALYVTEVRSEVRDGETILLAGPRVGVPFVGGRIYHALVCAHDPAALEDAREVIDERGLSWGRIVRGRASHETESRAWFLPPRPLQPAHLDRLYAAYVDARDAAEHEDVERLRRALSHFHFRFVHLHPFRCANQSLCMNLVNRLLLQGAGAAMPHGLLDQFALRLDEAAYEVVFARAAKRAISTSNAAERWSALQRETTEVYALIQRLQQSPDLEAARAVCEAAPHAAEAALIA